MSLLITLSYPNCTVPGEEALSCENCDYSITYELPTNDEHKYDCGVCTLCGYVNPDYVDPSLVEGIQIGHSLNLASDISINYVVKEADLTNYDSFYLVCNISDYVGDTQVSDRVVFLNPEQKGNLYYFTLDGITAVHMGNLIESTLYMTKDSEIYHSHVDVYSVATYAYTQMNKETTSPGLKTLCAELLRYGSAAQIFKSYRTNALPDEQMTQEQRELLTALETVTFQSINRTLFPSDGIVSVNIVGKTLNLESKVGVKFIVDPLECNIPMEEMELRYSYESYTGETITGSILGATLYNETLGYYSFEVDTILAADLRSTLTVKIYHNDTLISPMVEYAPDTYANGKTGNLLTLCQALFSYSDTALAFFKGK